VADEWFSDYPNINVMARAFLGGAVSPQHAGSLMAEGRLEAKCLELTTTGVTLASDELLRGCESVVNGERPPMDALRVALSIFHRVGIVGLKMSATEPHSWYAATSRRIDPAEITADTSVEVHLMFWSALQIVQRS
jgi:hypothetical protein